MCFGRSDKNRLPLICTQVRTIILPLKQRECICLFTLINTFCESLYIYIYCVCISFSKNCKYNTSDVPSLRLFFFIFRHSSNDRSLHKHMVLVWRRCTDACVEKDRDFPQTAKTHKHYLRHLSLTNGVQICMTCAEFRLCGSE